MYEDNMDEYLDEEVEALKLALEKICKEWEKQVGYGSASTAHVKLTCISRV
jgi:recyclin-1